jgi:hypothetical protein
MSYSIMVEAWEDLNAIYIASVVSLEQIDPCSIEYRERQEEIRMHEHEMDCVEIKIDAAERHARC